MKMNNHICAQILRLCESLQKLVEDCDQHFRTTVLRYCAGNWKSMVLTIIAVARKLCELQGQKRMPMQCVYDLTHITFTFREAEIQRWNERTFVLFLNQVPYVNPQMAFILMRLIEWIAGYPNLVSSFHQYFKKPEPYHDSLDSSQDGREVKIQITGDFFLFIVHLNNVFKKRLPSALFLQDVVFPHRVTGLCGHNPFIVFKNTSRERIRILRKSSLISLLIKRTFQGFSHQDLSHLMLFLAEYIYQVPLEG
jgi:hypothetical protein